ncbi:MAG: DUF1428 family protein [Gammaproteobacteria bacterium]
MSFKSLDAALVLNFDPQFIAQRFATFCNVLRVDQYTPLPSTTKHPSDVSQLPLFLLIKRSFAILRVGRLCFLFSSDDEVVMFGWVEFESRETRDRANEKVAADPRMADLINSYGSGFDARKMAYGGFQAFVR